MVAMPKFSCKLGQSVPYNVFAKCRLHKSGGGVLLYVKNGIKAVKISKTDVDTYDSLYVEVTKKNRKYVLGVVYRPPKQSEENNIMLYNEIKSIIKDKNAVVCGDFNPGTLTMDRRYPERMTSLPLCMVPVL